ncbi:MAG TPA: metabolite traffic protein EboE [Lentisphaeria bacterium]|nr:metabolite traffic protein EboE [Lentisphaeria bacterium]HQL88424.1 metabolite traffic protein EboE [Lentisphaeria bacterium]
MTKAPTFSRQPVLCHCMNVFPGTTPQAKLTALCGCLTEVKNRLHGFADRPFPVGLWLDAATAEALRRDDDARAAWASQLHAAGFEAVTANAFPYGRFHDEPVKTSVYHPDWTCPERRDYTIAVADLLSSLLPPDTIGSISTLPAGYRRHFPTAGEKPMLANILAVAEHLAKIHQQTGKIIRLGFEMEPDCLWEAPAEFADFFQRRLQSHEHAGFLGVCYDTCHQELLGHEPGAGLELLIDQGIPITKIQLSAAIRAPSVAAQEFLCRNFQDSVYLHQTRLIRNHTVIQSWEDLPLPTDLTSHSSNTDGEWRCHFHVPIFLDNLTGGLMAANAELKAVLAAVRKTPSLCPTLEIETYSYNVLPEFLQCKSLADCLVKEAQFAQAQIAEMNYEL